MQPEERLCCVYHSMLGIFAVCFQAQIYEEIDIAEASVAEYTLKNVNHAFQVRVSCCVRKLFVSLMLARVSLIADSSVLRCWPHQ